MVNLSYIRILVVIVIAFLTLPLIQNSRLHAENAIQQDTTIESGEHGNHSEEGQHGEGDHDLGADLPLWSVLPFVGILLSIAIFPLIAPRFWHHHFPKISFAWAVIFAIPFLFIYKSHAFHEIVHIYLIDYIPFIILLWSLFTIAGGVLVRGTLKGTPGVNVLIILIGTLLASWIGTTGAAMVMIRPLLRANVHRKHKAHLVVFFIFLAANIGGSLTPIGDPPLFLGFIHGVNFFWTFSLFPEMAMVVAILLVLLFVMDSYYYRKENVAGFPEEEQIPIRVEGAFNFIFLLGVVGGVIFSGLVEIGDFTLLGVHMKYQNVVRDLWLVFMGLLSLYFTSRKIREDNEFTWFPIKEVAYLFAGIFMTIIPALAILQSGEKGAMAFVIRLVEEPYHYFWTTGILSSFLDNAPTYLTFFNSALGKLDLTEAMISQAFDAGAISAQYPQFIEFLTAISLGAVFMGANTYIGNAPNFMVKSIAEESGINMPSFFGYMIKYSIPILFPIFIAVTLIFL